MTNPRTVAAPRAPTPSFTSNTASIGIMFGFIGMAVESSMDRSRLLGHSGPIRNPAGAIRASVVAALAKRFSLEVVDANAPSVTYDGSLRLTDARTKKVLAEDICSSHPVTGQPVGELARDGAAGLKDELSGVVDYCAEEYRHRVLGLY